MRRLAGIVGEGAVVITQGVPELVVASRTAEGLDVLVLVEGAHALGRELAADPIRLLEHVDGAATPGCGECRGHAPGAATDDENVALDHARRLQVADPHDGTGG